MSNMQNISERGNIGPVGTLWLKFELEILNCGQFEKCMEFELLCKLLEAITFDPRIV